MTHPTPMPGCECSRRIAVLLLGLCGVSAPSYGAGIAGLDLSGYRMVDLTQPFNRDTVYWPTDRSGFQLRSLAHGETAGGYFYAANAYCTAEHGGTHIDAPVHFARAGQTLEAVPLERLIAPAVVIDVTEAAGRDRDYRLTPQEVRAFEAEHGLIAAGSIVLLRTGWSRYWPERKRYLGDDTPGDASKLSFPSFGSEAARHLIEDRRVSALGVDTASIDYGRSKDFPVHRLLAKNSVPALENLTHLEGLPPRGALLIALPMKIEGGSGGPLRAVALVPRRSSRAVSERSDRG